MHRLTIVTLGLSTIGTLAAGEVASAAGSTVPAAANATPIERHMRHLLTAEHEQWRTPNPDYDESTGGPRAFGLTFDLAEDASHVTGRLTGIRADGGEDVYWTLLAMFNPVTGKVETTQIGGDGSLVHGSVPLQEGPVQIVDAVLYRPDGTMSLSRHETRFLERRVHESVVSEPDGEGGWAVKRRWTWTRTARPPAKAVDDGIAPERVELVGPLREHAAFLVAGSGRWRAPNPEYVPGGAEERFFEMRYATGHAGRHVRGEILSVFEDGRVERVWTMVLTHNPVTQISYLEQTGASGVYFRGELSVSSDGRRIQTGVVHMPDGRAKSVRDEIEIVDGRRFVSHVFERDAEGRWVESRTWTWTRQDADPPQEPVAVGDSGAVVLPSETCRGMFLVPVTVGSERAHMLIDTGASRSFLDPHAAARLAGRAVRPYRSLRLDGARIGEFEIGRLRAYVYPLERIGTALGRPIDGILGFPAFREVLLTFDYPAGEVRVERGRLPRPDGREIFRYRGWRRPHLPVQVGDRRVRIQFDTGSNGGWMVRPGAGLEWDADPRPARGVVLFSGHAVDPVGRLAESLRFGSLEFERPLVTLSMREPIVGWRVLRHFAVTFDQYRKRVRLATEQTEPVEEEPWAGFGVVFRPRGDAHEVVEVLDGAGAGARRLRPGDRVVEIDGVAVAEIGCGEPLGPEPGRRARFEVERDGRRFPLEVEAVRLVP